jgi:amino-acid N-acetyltransferase
MKMIRKPQVHEAETIQNLILLFSENGKILPREISDIRKNIADFLVYEMEGKIIAACSLKSGWDKWVEIRSLCVDPRYQGQGIARLLVESSIELALSSGWEQVFVLTYVPQLFKQFGFDVVDKDHLPMKVWNDCQACLHRDNCDEIAMTLPLVSLNPGESRDLENSEWLEISPDF